jgi:hypothetical protein
MKKNTTNGFAGRWIVASILISFGMILGPSSQGASCQGAGKMSNAGGGVQFCDGGTSWSTQGAYLGSCSAAGSTGFTGSDLYYCDGSSKWSMKAPSIGTCSVHGQTAWNAGFGTMTVCISGILYPMKAAVATPAPTTTTVGAAPVNCVGSWGACSAPCGPGTSTYTITTAAANGGAACSNNNGDTMGCNNGACAVPVDCAGTWSACDFNTGLATFTVTTPPANGGAACPASPSSAGCCSQPAPGGYHKCCAPSNSGLGPYWSVPPAHPACQTFNFCSCGNPLEWTPTKTPLCAPLAPGC